MVVASVYVPSSLHLDVFRMIHVFTWMALMMYIQCIDCEVGSECLNIMSSETYVGRLCFHSGHIQQVGQLPANAVKISHCCFCNAYIPKCCFVTMLSFS